MVTSKIKLFLLLMVFISSYSCGSQGKNKDDQTQIQINNTSEIDTTLKDIINCFGLDFLFKKKNHWSISIGSALSPKLLFFVWKEDKTDRLSLMVYECLSMFKGEQKRYLDTCLIATKVADSMINYKFLGSTSIKPEKLSSLTKITAPNSKPTHVFDRYIITVYAFNLKNQLFRYDFLLEQDPNADALNRELHEIIKSIQ